MTCVCNVEFVGKINKNFSDSKTLNNLLCLREVYTETDMVITMHCDFYLIKKNQRDLYPVSSTNSMFQVQSLILIEIILINPILSLKNESGTRNSKTKLIQQLRPIFFAFILQNKIDESLWFFSFRRNRLVLNNLM